MAQTMQGKTDQGHIKELLVDDNGQLVLASKGFALPDFDTITVGYPNALTEVYSYKQGSTTTGIMTVTYLDEEKAYLSSAQLEIV